MILKKKGKVSEVFTSKAKERRFAQEHRHSGRLKYSSSKGLRNGVLALSSSLPIWGSGDRNPSERAH